MSEIEPSPTSQFGYVELALRACGERPWRSFLLVWLALFLLSVAVSLLGFNHRSLETTPPDPQSIPYADWLIGGSKVDEGMLDLRVEDVPEFDESLTSPLIGVQMQWRSDADGGPRLIAWRGGYVGSLGWPWTSVTWNSIINWDVSDPTQPFPPIRKENPGGIGVQNYSYGFGWTNQDRTEARGFALYTPGAWMQFAAPQIVAAFGVGLAAVLYRVRRRRRRRRGRCTSCGHRLDPSRLASRCPECGHLGAALPIQTKAGSVLVATIGGPGRLSAALLGLALIIWFVAQRTVHWSDSRELDENLARRSQVAIELNRSFTGHAMVRIEHVGWPILLTIQDDHWFRFVPDAPPQRVAGGWSKFNWNSSSLTWSRELGNPSITRLYSLNWSMTLMQLATLQIASVIVGSGLWLIITRFVVRRRAKPQAAGMSN